MSEIEDLTKYDEALLTIIVNEKSILGFLSTIFNFLARRTDFYYVRKAPNENIGLPAGAAEELVLKILRRCDPKTMIADNNNTNPADINNEIMCSTVAQEVEVVTEQDTTETTVDTIVSDISESLKNNKISSDTPDKKNTASLPDHDYSPPKIPVQKNSESYNGAEREKYSWSQSILELDAVIKLPADIKSAKNLKVTINPSDICVQRRSDGEIIIKDSFPHKIKANDSLWSISEDRLMIHLEKQQERWWNNLLSQEEPIDLSKIDCSRRLDELPESHIAKVRELQWNQEQKLKGLPTSDELKNIDILKKAWNAEGSPFKGTEFDPSVLNTS